MLQTYRCFEARSSPGTCGQHRCATPDCKHCWTTSTRISPDHPLSIGVDYNVDPATGHHGEGMVHEQQSGTYIVTSPYNMERAMGFTPGVTAGPVGMIRTAPHRRSTLGLDLDRHIIN